MIKKIDFPESEVKKLKNQHQIVTTRVSKEYGKYGVGEVVSTPWNELYIITNIKTISDIKQHPYYQCLTDEQIQLISKYKRISVLTLKKHKNA